MLIVMSSVTTAGAATVSYVSGDNVWLSSFDGSKKAKISGPAGDGRVWIESAQSDNGRVIAVRREPGKVSQLNSFTLWGPDRGIVYQGALNGENGWSTYAFPVSIDLTADGRSVVYGYANSRGFFPTAQFEFGTYVKLADGPAAIEPWRIPDSRWPTVVGDRIVATSGGQVILQADTTASPYGSDPFAPWIDINGGFEAHRTDVAANGKVFGIDLDASGVEKIAMFTTGSLGDPNLGSGDCFLPAQGDASEVTLSQDGTMVAWHDDRGVLAAGIPDFSGAEPCNLTSPAVVLDANGTFPSIGAAQLPSNGGGGGGGGKDGNGGGGSGQTGGPIVNLPPKLKAASLKNGLSVRIKVEKAGKVTMVAKVSGRLVARGSARAPKAGFVNVKLKAVGSAAKKLAGLKGKTVVIKVTAGGKTTTIKRKLK